MFTSRAEYRLMLREDNADARLTPKARELGLVDEARRRSFEAKQEAVARERERLCNVWVRPQAPAALEAERLWSQPIAREYSMMDLLRRPEVGYQSLVELPGLGPGVADPAVAQQVEIQAKYAGYIARQHAEVRRNRRQEETALPADLDYAQVRGLSTEVREKLVAVRPTTLGQAARIPGVTPAAISLLLVHLKKRGHELRQSA
jgi:tRNA uridine 5-carboxymethylaminomethyl modification enzyme